MTDSEREEHHDNKKESMNRCHLCIYRVDFDVKVLICEYLCLLTIIGSPEQVFFSFNVTQFSPLGHVIVKLSLSLMAKSGPN